jgi:hypothetical protein
MPSIDLDALLANAHYIFNTFAPVFIVVLALPFGIGIAQFLKRQADELHALQNGRLNPPEAPYNPGDPLNYFTELKRKNEMKHKNDEPQEGDQAVVGFGPDGELIFEGEEVEPDHMHRFQ